MKTQEKNKRTKAKKFNPFWNGVPATMRRTLYEASLYESVFASFSWHIVGILLIWGLSFSLMFFGITPKLFPIPKTKIHDIEFTLKNSSRHGTHYQKPETIKKVFGQNSDEPSSSTKPQNNLPVISKTGQNNVKSKSGAGSKTEILDFAIPMPKLKSMSSGLGGSGSSSRRSVGLNSPSAGVSSESLNGGDSSTRVGFDKNAAKKIITTYDISPYVSELKRNIRWNWKAPTENVNKRVELFLRIARDGKIIILNVKKTSEIGQVDNAALNAVKKCTPLNPLPAKYSKNYLDIIFTFDANSVGSRY